MKVFMFFYLGLHGFASELRDFRFFVSAREFGKEEPLGLAFLCDEGKAGVIDVGGYV
jgi:hypothetical protein